MTKKLSWILIQGSDAATIQNAAMKYAGMFARKSPQKHRANLYSFPNGQFALTFDPPAPPYSFANTISWLDDANKCAGSQGAVGWLVSPGSGERYHLGFMPGRKGDTLQGISERGVSVSVYLPDCTLGHSTDRFSPIPEPVLPAPGMKKVASFEVTFDARQDFGNPQFVFDGDASSLETENIYPYVVPSGYLAGVDPGPPGFYLSLGHDIHALLYRDLGNSCVNIRPRDLPAAGLSATELHHLALENLTKLAQGTAFTKSLHHAPNGMPFLVWTDHWLAASCCRLPGLFKFASQHLQSEKLCVSIPQRELMIVFPFGTSEQRQQMRALVYENEKDARKLITWELFTLTAAGLQPHLE